MYEIIANLCTQKGVNITQMCREANVPRGNLTDLKKGRQSGLSAKNLQKIADYFDVPMGYLLGAEETKKAAPLSGGDLDARIIDVFLRLNTENQQRALDFLAGLLAAQGD